MTFPKDLKYTKDHEWIRVEGNTGVIGITDYAQGELGDIVFVELPAPGTKVQTGKSFGTIEAVKAVSDLYAPVSGEVTEVNETGKKTPDVVNKDPYGSGWMVKISFADPAEAGGLMDADAYGKHVGK
ncbi:MAG: glycine cleavage system protein GcvH [Bacteroidota bacterium]